ncbi:MAG: hypothetical protein OXF02_00165 [Simkaniaceae bacterium]|nr:hypothetical protein [Simkaniaceae bacterium]
MRRREVTIDNDRSPLPLIGFLVIAFFYFLAWPKRSKRDEGGAPPPSVLPPPPAPSIPAKTKGGAEREPLIRVEKGPDPDIRYVGTRCVHRRGRSRIRSLVSGVKDRRTLFLLSEILRIK